MKAKHLLSMTALLLAAVMTSCNSDDLTESVLTPDDTQPKMIKLTATIGPKAEGTRLLEEMEGENGIKNSWSVGDNIAMIIGDKVYKGTVSTIKNGYATITGDIEDVASGTEVTFRYPYPAVAGIAEDEGGARDENVNGEFKKGILKAQLGTLNDIDKRSSLSEGVGKLRIDDDTEGNKTATLEKSVILENKIVIFKFEFASEDGDITNISKLVVDDADGNRLYEVRLPKTLQTEERNKVYVAMYPVDGSNLTFRVTTPNNEDVYTTTKKATLRAGYFYTQKLTMSKVETVEVDLGLSVIWASMNVGATKETEYGDFFAWAETTGHSTDRYADDDQYRFTSVSAPYLIREVGPSEFEWSKYTNTSEKLTSEDDAAHVNWGNGWRMPTEAEFQELLNKTTSTYLEYIPGVYGVRFTSTVPGYTDKSIFLPAVGNRNDGEIPKTYYESFNMWGADCYYWASTLDNFLSPHMGQSFVYLKSWSSKMMQGNFRHIGQSIRPVRDK